MIAPLLIMLLVLGACTATGTLPPTPSTSPTDDPTLVPTTVPHEAARVRVELILRTTAALVDRPREATSRSFHDAANEVARRFRSLGLRVRSQRFDVPVGISWGVRVPAGTSRNVIAEPPGFRDDEPHLIVGAHLDTVPQAPGANDNGAGVAAMLELARLAAVEPPRLPIVFVAFGAEEPRTSDGTGHHYGSRAYVAAMAARTRAAMAGVVSLDRIGIGRGVRVCTTSGRTDGLARAFLRRADRLGISASICANRASDHVPFADAGMPGVRLLGEDDPNYHTSGDTIEVLEPAQLRRITTLAWETVKRFRA